MSTLTLAGRHSGSPRTHFGFVSFFRNRWREHRLMRSIESVPYAVMKDIGFPAAERVNDL